MGLAERFSDVIPHNVNQKCSIKLKNGMKFSGSIADIPVPTTVVAKDGLTYLVEKKGRIKIYNSQGKQVGFYDNSGGLKQETFENQYSSHKLIHIIGGWKPEGDMCESYEFTEHFSHESRITRINTRGNRIISGSVKKYESENTENGELDEYNHNNRLIQSVSYLMNDNANLEDRSYGSSFVCNDIDELMIGYRLIKHNFDNNCKRVEEISGISITWDDETGMIVNYADGKVETIPISDIPRGNSWYEVFNDEFHKKMKNGLGFLFGVQDEARRLSHKENDLLCYYKGEYIGNIMRKTDEGYIGCIVTKTKKEGQDYRVYYLVDFRGISFEDAFDWIDPNDEEGYKIFEKLKANDKNRYFVTRISDDGSEEYVCDGGETSKICHDYATFVHDFVAPFYEISPDKEISLEDILDRKEQTI